MRLGTRSEVSLEVGFLIQSLIFKKTRREERDRNKDNTPQQGLYIKQSNFGVLITAVQAISPQRFVVEDLAEVL